MKNKRTLLEERLHRASIISWIIIGTVITTWVGLMITLITIRENT